MGMLPCLLWTAASCSAHVNEQVDGWLALACPNRATQKLSVQPWGEALKVHDHGHNRLGHALLAKLHSSLTYRKLGCSCSHLGIWQHADPARIGVLGMQMSTCCAESVQVLKESQALPSHADVRLAKTAQADTSSITSVCSNVTASAACQQCSH